MSRTKLLLLLFFVPGFCFGAIGNELSGQNPVEAPADWFAKSASGSRATPRADYGEPADSEGFYLWSWNEFLWLTQPSDPGNAKSAPKFLKLAPAASLFPPLGQDPPAYSTIDAEKMNDLAFRAAKREEDHAGGEHGITQAGSLELLVDSVPGGGNPIFYTMQVNEEYYSFVQSNSLYKKSVLSKLNPTDALAQFPNGAVEIKSSWLVTKTWKPGEDPNTDKPTVIVPDAGKRYFVMISNIGAAETKNGRWVESDEQHSAELALIGMHVVGKLDKHPELNWATFEHIDVAPDHSAVPSSKDWVLYKAGTPASACNIGLTPSASLAPTPVSRLNPDGMLPSTPPGDPNKKAIDELNQSVSDQLSKAFPDSVWKNYRLIGAIWTDGTLPVVSSGANANEGGTLYLANSTMESFTQFGVANAALQTKNCFTCHNTEGTTAPANLPLSVSHLITNFAQNDIVQLSLREQYDKLDVKEKCFTVPDAIQTKISQGPDYWRQCMLGATNNQIDLWNCDSVVGNAGNIDQHLHSKMMPPGVSGGPLSDEALKVWDQFYARVQFELVVKPQCLTVPQSTQASMGISADDWHVCMRDNMGVDIWDCDLVIANAKLVNGKLHDASDPMPPLASGGPLSVEALATWDEWYKMISTRGVISP